MPTRTFSALDIINYAVNVTHEPLNTANWVISGTGFSDFLAQVTDSQNVGTPPGCRAAFVADLTGSFDFQIFPALPITALINSVKLRYEALITGQSQSFSGVEDSNAFANVLSSFIEDISGSGYPYFNLIAPDVSNEIVPPTETQSATSNATATLASSEITYALGAISYAVFIALFENIALRVSSYLYSGDTFHPAAVNSGDGVIQITSLELEVTYNEGIAGSWFIENDEEPIKVGSVIHIINDIVGEPGLEGVSSITFTYGPGPTVCTVAAIDFHYQSPTEIILYAPFCLGSFVGEVTVAAVGNGTTFSGSVALGVLTVYFEDGSGIYRIVKGKTTDTVYDPARDGTTSEVKIPNPFGATGFIDG